MPVGNHVIYRVSTDKNTWQPFPSNHNCRRITPPPLGQSQLPAMFSLASVCSERHHAVSFIFERKRMIKARFVYAEKSIITPEICSDVYRNCMIGNACLTDYKSASEQLSVSGKDGVTSWRTLWHYLSIIYIVPHLSLIHI